LYHKRFIDDQYERLKQYEVTLNNREATMKVEEERRLAHMESMKKTMMDEASIYRKNVEEDLIRERNSLDELKRAMQDEKEKFQRIFDEKHHSQELQQLHLQAQEKQLSVDKIELENYRIELQKQKSMIEPYLLSATQQRDEAAALKRQAEDLMRANEERISKIIKKEQDIVVLEHQYLESQRRKVIDDVKLSDDRRLVHSKAIQLQALQQELRSERFRIHQKAIEIANISFHLQKYVRQLRSLRGADHDVDTYLDKAMILGQDENRTYNQRFSGAIKYPSNILHELDSIHHIATTAMESMSTDINEEVKDEPSSHIITSLSSMELSASIDNHPLSHIISSHKFDSPAIASSLDIQNSKRLFKSSSSLAAVSNPNRSPLSPNTLESSIHVDSIRTSIESVETNANQLKNFVARFAA
jgi:hypothetical protein